MAKFVMSEEQDTAIEHEAQQLQEKKTKQKEKNAVKKQRAKNVVDERRENLEKYLKIMKKMAEKRKSPSMIKIANAIEKEVIGEINSNDQGYMHLVVQFQHQKNLQCLKQRLVY